MLVSRVIEKANMSGQSHKGAHNPRYILTQDVLAADRELRAFDVSLPVHLRCGAAPLWRLNPEEVPSLSAYEQDPVLGYEGLPRLLAVQQLRLAQLYNMSMCESTGKQLSPVHLHRSSFITALRGISDPLNGPLASSVLALIVESSGNMLFLTTALFQIAPNFTHFAVSLQQKEL